MKVRLPLALLALSAALPGVWATLAPHGFFDDFPGPGAGAWVASLPPFNEHLARDAGAFYLAFSVLFAWAAARPDRALVVPLTVAWSAFSLLHLGYHLTALGSLATRDAILQTASLVLVLGTALIALRLSLSSAAPAA